MDKSNDDIRKIVNDEINKFVKNELDGEMKKVITKSGTQSRNELIKTIKDSLESVYKLLWQKRDFWKNDIK